MSLRHAQGISRGAVRSSSSRRAISEDVLRWRERRGEVPQLLERFETEMSPRALFDLLPLSRCTEATRRWLIPVIHELWLARGHLREKIAKAMKAYGEAERVYEHALAEIEKLSDSPSIAELLEIDKSLNAFTTSCELLSRCISDLPRDIRCV